LLGSVIVITVIGGVALALSSTIRSRARRGARTADLALLRGGRTVNALLWKHMMMNPIYGVFAPVSDFSSGCNPWIG